MAMTTCLQPRHLEQQRTEDEEQEQPLAVLVEAFLPTKPLTGLPGPVVVDGVSINFGPNLTARRAAIAYCIMVGLPLSALPTTYAKIDKDKARHIATLYDELEPTPTDGPTQASYRAFASETLAQWRIIKYTGLRLEYCPSDYGKPDPYSNPRRLILDVTLNNHLYVKRTQSAYGDQAFTPDPLNPLLDEVPDERISGKIPLVNDILRAVHDYFGHVREGLGFRCEGEYNAWRGHMAMYSPLARRAMTLETLGQNCWINYGPFAASNRCAGTKDTRYAPQKLGLLPVGAADDMVNSELPVR